MIASTTNGMSPPNTPHAKGQPLRELKNDLTGKRFARLTAIERCRVKGHNMAWVADCDCGRTVVVRSDSLMNCGTKSCGCLRNELTVARNRERKRLKETKQPATQAPPPAQRSLDATATNNKPTAVQRRVLKRFGFPTNVDKQTATRLIASIAANGWQLPRTS